MYVLGLMSGTSADGVDASLVEFTGNPDRPKWKLINSTYINYPSELKQAIVDFGQGSQLTSAAFLELSESITEFYALAAKDCDPSGLAPIAGCHGQTVFHRPPNQLKRGVSLQMLNAPLLAIILNRDVVFDFRSKDLALGGHGAPLVPLLDAALLGRTSSWRGVLNLGGIANISLIPPNCGPDKHANVLGWDIGPGNSLIDLAVQKITNGKLNFDCNGLLALGGSPDIDAIKKWLQEPFFNEIPPKSTGRELFGRKDLERRLNEMGCEDIKDKISTLTVFTAALISQDLDNLYQRKRIKPIELVVSGGGSKNPALLQEIISRCRGMKVFTSKEVGIPVQARESLTFALLAWWNLLNKTGSTFNTTGLSKPIVLGVKVTPN